MTLPTIRWSRTTSLRASRRVARYAALCEDWFFRSDDEYTARLDNYRPRGGRALRPDEVRNPGPKLQSVGLIEAGQGDSFTETSAMDRSRRAVVWTRWTPYGRPHHTRWRWTSPSGEESWSDADLKPEWDATYTLYPGKLPMQAGGWTVTHVDDGRPGLVSRFTVR